MHRYNYHVQGISTSYIAVIQSKRYPIPGTTMPDGRCHIYRRIPLKLCLMSPFGQHAPFKVVSPRTPITRKGVTTTYGSYTCVVRVCMWAGRETQSRLHVQMPMLSNVGSRIIQRIHDFFGASCVIVSGCNPVLEVGC